MTKDKVLMGAKIILNNHLQQQGVCHIVALPFTLKNILRQKRNYETQIFHHAKNTIFKIP
jgi:hypothetical protein